MSFFVHCSLPLRLLGYVIPISNFPGIDKIYYFVHCAHAGVAKFVAVLNDETLFGPIDEDRIEIMAYEADEVFGGDDKYIGMIEL